MQSLLGAGRHMGVIEQLFINCFFFLYRLFDTIYCYATARRYKKREVNRGQTSSD